jgi:hypothetical protein
MFSELFDAIRWGFGFAITIGIIILVVAIINAKKDAEEAERRRQIEEKEKRKLMNTVISEARQFPTDVVISQKDEVGRVCMILDECRRTGAFKAEEFAWIRVGDQLGAFMDRDTAYTILRHLNAEIERRKGRG